MDFGVLQERGYGLEESLSPSSELNSVVEICNPEMLEAALAG